eukprot:6752712-Pyramimonas_sp.AAC.1
MCCFLLSSPFRFWTTPPLGPIKLVLGGLGGRNYIYRRVKPDPFPMPQSGQPFVPGDVSSWPGFDQKEGESVD